jgi:hypothetical protein
VFAYVRGHCSIYWFRASLREAGTGGKPPLRCIAVFVLLRRAPSASRNSGSGSRFANPELRLARGETRYSKWDAISRPDLRWADVYRSEASIGNRLSESVSGKKCASQPAMRSERGTVIAVAHREHSVQADRFGVDQPSEERFHALAIIVWLGGRTKTIMHQASARQRVARAALRSARSAKDAGR